MSYKQLVNYFKKSSDKKHIFTPVLSYRKRKLQVYIAVDLCSLYQNNLRCTTANIFLIILLLAIDHKVYGLLFPANKKAISILPLPQYKEL